MIGTAIFLGIIIVGAALFVAPNATVGVGCAVAAVALFLNDCPYGGFAAGMGALLAFGYAYAHHVDNYEPKPLPKWLDPKAGKVAK